MRWITIIIYMVGVITILTFVHEAGHAIDYKLKYDSVPKEVCVMGFKTFDYEDKKLAAILGGYIPNNVYGNGPDLKGEIFPNLLALLVGLLLLSNIWRKGL